MGFEHLFYIISIYEQTRPPLLLCTAFLRDVWVFTNIIRGFPEKGRFFTKLRPIGFPEIWVCIPLVSEASSWLCWVAEVPDCGSFREVNTMCSALLWWRCTLSWQTAQHKGFTGPLGQDPGTLAYSWTKNDTSFSSDGTPKCLTPPCHQDTLWHRQETGRWQLRTSRPCQAVDHHLLEPPEGLATSPLQHHSLFRATAL